MNINTIRKEKNLLFLLWLITLGIAVYLRSVNLNFGLPQRLHPDEWSQVEVAWRMANGDWNPHFFRYPAGHMTLLAAIYFIWSFFSHLELFNLYLAARWVSVLFGTLSVVLAGVWASRLWKNNWAGLTAGLFAAFSWTWIEQSHYAVVDTPLMFWSGLVLFALSESPNKAGWQWLATLALGFAVANKYTAALLFIPFFISFWFEILPENSLSQASHRWVIGILSSIGLINLGLFTGLGIWQNEILHWATSLTSDNHLEKEYLNLYSQLTALNGLTGILFFALIGALLRWQNWKVWARLFHPKPYFLLLIALGVFVLLSPFTLIEWRQSA